MGKYTFEIPEEVEAWILSEKKIKPETYIQNQFVDSIIIEYERELGQIKKVEAEKQTKKEVEALKTKITVTGESKVK